ncbi:MAG: twin-arginine translocase TatA/TatE family subunit [Croceibacterium sp.]
MGSFSLFHWIIVAAIVLLLFGRGRIADVMGDFGKGISSFKKGMAEAEKEPEPVRQIQAQAPPPAVDPVAPVRTPEEEAAARRDPG